MVRAMRVSMGDDTKKMGWRLRAGDDGGGDWKITTGGKADRHCDRETRSWVASLGSWDQGRVQ